MKAGLGLAGPERASPSLALEPNKRGCNKRGCKSKICGKKRNLPNLGEIGRICATLAEFAGNEKGCKSIVFAKFAQICAKFAGPFVTAPSVPVRSLAGSA